MTLPPASPAESKAALRAGALARRDALSLEFRVEASIGVASRAGELGIAPGSVVSGFLPIRSEIDARPLMSAIRALGCTLCLPAVVSRTEIVFRRFDRNIALAPAGFGTLAPPADAEIMTPSVMLVPLSAFDERGHRIGYGAGHYDRAIARQVAAGKTPRLIGLGFACQLVARVPDEVHDRALDMMLTEQGLRTFPLAG
jgi:5-formyltetrahydrofolate cyclo-ligase